MGKKNPDQKADELRPVYLRLERDLVAFLDAEAKRQRRSRAYVVAQAVRLLRAVVEQMESERWK